VFLDTNVINVLVKHSAHVFDHEPIPLETESTLATDIEALMHVFYVGHEPPGTSWLLKGHSMNSRGRETARCAKTCWNTRWALLIEISAIKTAGTPQISGAG
jgi:hypothetical protein